jgi:hypothetical protein
VFPAIVTERKNGSAATWQVGDQKTQVGSGLSMFSLVADAPLVRPGVSAIEEAGKGARRLTGPTITFRETMLQLLSFTLQ